MTRNRIIFPEAYKAELVKEQIEAPGENDVLIRTQYSTISPGTERANYTGDPNVSGATGPSVRFPRGSGYSSAGIVLDVGANVNSVKPGDRVICYWGVHADINRVPETRVVKIDYDKLSLREASTLFIATFPMAAIRKTRLEVGESCMIMGLGLLGQFAVRIAKAAGAVPVIACDPVESRRNDALNGGADYALNPMEPGFADEVKRITGKRAN
jgi:2-desacetyl-2-hydroxyethyl bacteriochlorophyllide A dehydrogenase